MQSVLAVLVGTVLGAMVFDWKGMLFGAALGWAIGRVNALTRRVAELEKRALSLPVTAATESPPPPARMVVESSAPEPVPVPDTPPAEPAPTVSVWGASSPVTAEPESMWMQRLRELVFGGNTAVRLGVVVLFFGVAFMLKYAVEHSLLPIELRLTGAALGGIALLIIGWRLREKRAGYALTLQGGGIGILYLTVFAALRLYALLSPVAAFALLIGIVVFSALLALRQASLALAALGITGGFLAPILTSTGAGNHVMLFSYYALLNTGILFISWFRAWRVLNVVGFGFTFVIGALWGYRSYQPEFFASTEPFLILFFLMYVAIAVLMALRQPPELRGWVDGTLVFGVPIVGALLQAALVRDMQYGMAWSALALGFFYLTLAGVLFRRVPQTLRLLSEVFLALGVIFATLAIPLAFEGRWTAAAWAVEGAGILWVGVRQLRASARWFGIVLIIFAGLFFVGDYHATGGWPVLNAHYIGTLLIAAAALVGGRILHGAREKISASVSTPALLVWGLLWWYGGGLREIERQVAATWEAALMGVFVALSCLVVEMLGRRWAWPALRISAIVLIPALMLYLLFSELAGVHPFAKGGYAVWLIGFAVFSGVARRQDAEQVMLWPTAQHTLIYLLLTTVATREVAWVLGELVPEGRDWARMAWLAVPAAMLTLASLKPVRWPLSQHRPAYFVYAAVLIAFGAMLGVLALSAESAGDAAPLGYLPLLNPLELATLFLALALAHWLISLRQAGGELVRDVWPMLAGAAVVTAFVFLNAVLFRALHHFAGIAWRFEAMFHSVLAQAALSIFWSSIALLLVIAATRLKQRPVWIAGAVLLGAVVLKLFVIDLAGTGTVARIVSFIGVGVLLLIIGYLAPVPPRVVMEENK